MKKILYTSLFLMMAVLSLNAQVDRSKRPVSGPAPTINLGNPQTFKMKNGLEVLVVENHKLPQVSFSLKIDNPPFFEGEIKGVDDLASEMMGNGSTTVSKEKFNETLDFYAASANLHLDGFGGSCLSRHFTDVFGLVVDGALNPLLTQDELDSKRNQYLDGLKADEKNPKQIVREVRSKLLYTNHPFGEIVTAESLNKVTLDDVKKRHKDSYIPSRAYLVVVGDVKFKDVKKLAEKHLSKWTSELKFFPPRLSHNIEPRKNTEICFVDVPNAVQSEISISNLVDLKMTNSDYFAALLANQVVGGGADGRLFKNLRETHGWTYGSYSNINADIVEPTSFTATASVRNQVTDSAVVEMMKEINLMSKDLSSKDELDLAKAKYVGGFVMGAEKPTTVANFAITQRIQALPADFFKNYIKNVEAVTLENVRDASSKYVLGGQSQIVVVGKAVEVLEKLEKLGYTVKYYDRLGNPVERPDTKLPATAE